jgi:mRNA-degrading endonuclease RelE of RelBE toxin-antitoxin system
MRTKSYSVIIEKKALKGISKLPLKIQKKLNLLAKDLRDIGPIQPNWPNYSKLGNEKYHCHLDYSWVACWKNEKETLIIEVYYVGSREKAPY